MVKTRMSVVDCARMAAEVNSLLAGSWVQNIYTTEEDPKTFLFKLTGRGDKYFLLIESGVRFHPTEFIREKSEMPTGFAMKLRKHVRGRRLEYCRQVGLDRVVDFAFGKGTQHHHVVLEMYAGGNVILTDENGVILTLLRPYTLEEESEAIRVAVGQKYPFDLAMEGPRALLFNKGDAFSVQPTDLQQFIETYLSGVEEEESKYGEEDEEEAEEEEQVKPKKGPTTVKGAAPPVPPQKKKKKKDKKKRPAELEHRRDLVQCLVSKGSPVQSFGPQLIEHCLWKAGFHPMDRIASKEYASKNSPALCRALEEAPRVLALLNDENKELPGYITLSIAGEHGKEQYYEGFEPFAWASGAGTDNNAGSMKEFPSFHDAVDEFYAKIEAQKAEKARQAAEKANQSKIENVKRQQAERVEQLKAAVDERDRAAQALERNVDLVDKAISAVNSLLASGMAWDDVDRVVKSEKRSGNPVASIVATLKLAENKITVALSADEYDDEQEELEEEAEDEEKRRGKGAKKSASSKVLVDIDLALTAQANVSAMFADKKRAAAKAQVTLERAAVAVEEMQAKLSQQQDRKKGSGKQQGVRAVRKPFWFEKFHWFLTSEGILVLGGKDAHQNELLFKRFLRKGDAYLHADIHGAPTVIVRNPFFKTGTAKSIPAESMRQAGVFCVCKSPAWQAKIVTSAWWVESYQVSRTAPTGEFLPTGSFMIRGKKNYLQPTKLEMGFGYIFKIDLTAVEQQQQTSDNNNEQGRGEGDDDVNRVRDKEWRYLRGNLPPPPEFATPAVLEGGEGEQPQSGGKEVYSLIDVGTAELQKQQQSRQHRNNNKPSATGAAKNVPQSTDSTKTDKGTASKDKTSMSRKKALKIKRAQAKYGDQTEEERRLAMIALGHALPSPSPAEEEEGDEAAKDEDMEEEGDEDDEEKAAQQPQSWLGKQQQKKTTESAAVENTEGPSKQEKDDDEEEDEEEAAPPGVAADDGDEPDMEDVLLKGFTAVPQPGDIILYALPFCAPIDSMAHFKFRVKLTPGTLKKGKAAKQALALFQSKCTDRERAVINSVSDPENVAVMMMDVKVSAPGLEKVRATIKNQQKKKKEAINSQGNVGAGADKQ